MSFSLGTESRIISAHCTNKGRSVTMLGKTGMAESGLGSPYWFSATQNGVTCRNVTYKECLGTTQYEKTNGVKKGI